jgi:hypothetical protein
MVLHYTSGRKCYIHCSLQIVFVFLFLTGTVFARNNDSIPKYDTSYYVSLRNKLTVYTYGITKFSQFDISNTNNDKDLSFRPNTKFNLGLGFSYKWLGLSTTFNFRSGNKDDAIFGKTTSFDIQSDIYTRRMIVTINLQSYQGFYWENVGDYDPAFSKADSFIIRPDINTANLGVNLIYTFKNDRFSFKAAYSNTEWQKKSAGSWLAGAFTSLYGISADSSIVPYLARDNFPTYYGVNGFGTFNIGASFGYTYTYVWHKKYFVNGTLMLGILDQAFLSEDTTGSIVLVNNHVSSKTHFRLALGFNNEKQNFGISVIADSFIIDNKSADEFSFNYGKVNLFYTRRFDLNWKFRKRKYQP